MSPVRRWTGSGWGTTANWNTQQTTTAQINAAAEAEREREAALAAQRDAQAAADRAAAAAAAQAAAQAAADAAAEAARRTSAMDLFRKYFSNLGVNFDAEIEAIIFDAMMKGMTPDDVPYILPEIEKTKAFNARFTGYAAYKANHQGTAINLQDYIDLEIAYTNIMANAGIPKGFYDDYSDFGDWIAKGISPEELSGRVRMATDMAKQVDPTMRNLMARFYGLSTGDVAAYFLDPNRAAPLIEHQYKTAEVASWASRFGYQINDMQRYQDLVESGVSGQQAAQSYGTIKQLDETVGRIAGIYGESYGQSDAEQDVFFNRNEKRRRIVAQEQATFSGSSRGQTGSAQRQSY